MTEPRRHDKKRAPRPSRPPGTVYLVGAGPGDPGLITARGIECLRTADLVVYDRLSNPALLEYAPEGAERVPMGKEPATPAAFQRAINATLVRAAKAGKTVVRLKGGDPFVFGRGGEEAAALHAAGVPFEVVPGVTSAIAVPAYAGVPVTQRRIAAAFTVVTGSEDPSKPEPAVDWAALAKVPGTLVVLMGWSALPGIVRELLAHGRPPSTPVAVTQWGTLPSQRTVTGTLASIVRLGTRAGLGSPAVITIGDVVSLRDAVGWFERRPLFGKRILVTRARQQAGTLSKLIAERGGEVLELPAIEVLPLTDHTLVDESLADLGEYGWAVFTSANAVDAVFGRLRALDKDARAFGGLQVAAIGPATAEALERRGISADYMPDTASSDAVSEGFRRYNLSGVRVLLPRADIATETLPDGLRRQGAAVDEVPVYRTVRPAAAGTAARELLGSGTVHAIAFTSSSAVRNLVDMLGGDTGTLRGTRVISIGPATSKTARELGLRVDAEAAEHTVPGLVHTLVRRIAPRGRRPLSPRGMAAARGGRR